MNENNEHQQKGTILVFCAIFLSALLMGILSLAIDLGLIFNAHTGVDLLANHLALAGMEGFRKTPTSLDDSYTRDWNEFDFKITESRNAIQNIINSVEVHRKKFNIKIAREQAGDNPDSDATLYYSVGNYYGKNVEPNFCKSWKDATNSELWPDKDEQYKNTNCPCSGDTDADYNGPCFQPNFLPYKSNKDSPAEYNDGLDVNAFRVRLKLNEQRGIKPFFAGSDDKISISHVGIASSVPRKIMIMMSLASSMVRETHPFPIEYAFELEKEGFEIDDYKIFKGWGSSENVLKDNQPNEYDRFHSCPSSGTTPYVGGGRTRGVVIAAGSPLDHLYPSLCSNKTKCDMQFASTQTVWNKNWIHEGMTSSVFQEKYGCMEVTYEDNPPFVGINLPGHNIPMNGNSEEYLNVTSYYMIDTNTIPEPLNTVFQAIDDFIGFFKDYSSEGDEAGLAAYDYSARMKERTFELEHITENSELKVFLDNVTTDNDDKKRLKAMRQHIMFPRSRSNSHQVHALDVAGNVLSQGSQESNNHIVLITDGISSCYVDTNNDDPTPCIAKFDNYWNAFSDPDNMRRQIDDLLNNGIKLHILLVGEQSNPHHLFRKSSNSTGRNFMSLKEMIDHKKLQPDFQIVDGYSKDVSNKTEQEKKDILKDDFYKRSRGQFYHPNELANLAIETGGNFMPVMKPCTKLCIDAGKANCSHQDITDELQTLVSSCTNCSEPNAIITANDSPYIKGSRAICDVLNRKRLDQIKDFLKGVFDSNPFFVVDDGLSWTGGQRRRSRPQPIPEPEPEPVPEPRPPSS